MTLRVLRRRNASRTPMIILGSLLGYELYRRRSPLRNDSSSGAQWPRTQPVILEPEQEASQQAIVATRSGQDELSAVTVGSSKTSRPEDLAGRHSAAEDEELHTWGSFDSKFAKMRSSISDFRWSSIGENIADLVPAWARSVPDFILKLQQETSMASGSLAEEIWQEAFDNSIHPEIERDARVRISKSLCQEEYSFRERRKEFTAHALAQYLGIPEQEINPEDVPCIALCASGGGLRALVAGAGSYLSAQEAGLFDCVTYTAGVSGSCWLQTLYYSTLGKQRHDRIVEHLKKRIGVHIAFPPTALSLLTTAPTNKYLLSGFVEKIKGDPSGTFNLVDVYGMLLASRLLVPKNELGVDNRDLKISNQRAYIDGGRHPLPIYTAVRHEIPIEEKQSDREKAEGKASDETKEKAKQEAWFQWLEFTPYEIWCEEFEAGVPAWSAGRHFYRGRNVPSREHGSQLPELRVPFLMGIWGSAFCATLSHYYKEVRPLLKGFIGFADLDDLVEENTDDLAKVHPIAPASIPNYVLGLEKQLPATCPRSVFTARYLYLMDAGMSNNLPIYPLLRSGRDVDILVAFDASANIEMENWISVVDGYAKQRGVKAWPMGAGWPTSETSKDDTQKALDAVSATSAQEAAGKVADAREDQRRRDEHDEPGKSTQEKAWQHRGRGKEENDLTYCNVWVGTTLERTAHDEPPPSKRVSTDAEWRILAPDAGITLIYFPLLPNPKAEGVDPQISPFMSTWNFVYTPEEIDKVVSLAKANFEEGKEQTKRTIMAVYERKKKTRLLREETESRRLWRKRMEREANHFR